MKILLLLLIKALLLLFTDFEIIQYLLAFLKGLLNKGKLESAVPETFLQEGKANFKGELMLSYTYELVLKFLLQ